MGKAVCGCSSQSPEIRLIRGHFVDWRQKYHSCDNICDTDKMRPIFHPSWKHLTSKTDVLSLHVQKFQSFIDSALTKALNVCIFIFQQQACRDVHLCPFHISFNLGSVMCEMGHQNVQPPGPKWVAALLLRELLFTSDGIISMAKYKDYSLKFPHHVLVLRINACLRSVRCSPRFIKKIWSNSVHYELLVAPPSLEAQTR